MCFLCTFCDICNSFKTRLGKEKLELTVVSQVLVQDSGKHEGLVEELVNALFVRFNANNTVLCERSSAFRRTLVGGSG